MCEGTQTHCEMPAYQSITTDLQQLPSTNPTQTPTSMHTTLSLQPHECMALLPSSSAATPPPPVFVSKTVLRQYARLTAIIVVIQLVGLLVLTIYQANTQLPDPTQAAALHGILRDVLPRYPTPSVLGALRLLDYIGTISFAHSGSNLAAMAGMDVFGAVVIGTVTAIGGGSIRDAFILSRKPFWTTEIEYIYLAFATAALTYLLSGIRPVNPARIDSPLEVFVDALCIGAFSVIGAQNALREESPFIICIICGVSTATFGGLFRDVLCKRDVHILHSAADIYATTAMAGSSFYMAAWYSGGGLVLRVGGGVLIAFVLRLLAWSRGFPLPAWKAADLEDAVSVKTAETSSASPRDCVPSTGSPKECR